MTTKDYCSSPRLKEGADESSTINHIPYTNLNLNDNCGSLRRNSIRSKSELNDGKINYCSSTVGDDLHTKNFTNFFDQNVKSPKLSNCPNLFTYTKTNENQMNTDKYCINKEATTLSLHIKCYENAMEAANPKKMVGNNESNSKLAWKDIKKTFLSSTSKAPLNEIPRQQENESSEPEVMQFKSSQHLLNLNDLNNIEFNNAMFDLVFNGYHK
jgi:hypothetical protein